MTWTVVTDAQLAVNKPARSTDIKAIRDNITSVALGEANAPNVALNFFHAQDQRAASTDYGAAAAKFSTRIINTVLTNNISGASLSSNQITLPAGTYHISAEGTVAELGGTALYLVNITDSTPLVFGYGTNAFATEYSKVSVTLRGSFTLAGTKVLEVRHAYVGSPGTDKIGEAVNLPAFITGEPLLATWHNTYLNVEIWKRG